MGDKQPSAAAMRLIDAQDAAVREHLRSVNMQFGVALTYERERSIRTLALDDAGVGKAVETIQEVRGTLFRLGKYTARDLGEYTTWVDAMVKDLDTALASLTGDDDA